jgi:hypothetical protein
MNIKSRLKKIEDAKKGNGAPKVKAIEIYGTREDGTTYLMETWRLEDERKEPTKEN